MEMATVNKNIVAICLINPIPMDGFKDGAHYETLEELKTD